MICSPNLPSTSNNDANEKYTAVDLFTDYWQTEAYISDELFPRTVSLCLHAPKTVYVVR